MTFRQKLLKELFESGLFSAQAEAVVAHYVASDLGKEMRGRLDEPLEGYPPTVYIATWMGVKLAAVEWIDANCPQHWARPMFTN